MQVYTRRQISSSCPAGRMRCPVKQQVNGRLFMILSSLRCILYYIYVIYKSYIIVRHATTRKY